MNLLLQSSSSSASSAAEAKLNKPTTMLLCVCLALLGLVYVSSAHPFIKVYQVDCPNQTELDQWYCNKLIGWCNLLTKWSDLITINLECCYEVNEQPPENLFVNETIRDVVNRCVRECEGTYKYVQCNGAYVDTIKEKTIVSKGEGEIEVVE